jgi:hypothetical protein
VSLRTEQLGSHWIFTKFDISTTCTDNAVVLILITVTKSRNDEAPYRTVIPNRMPLTALSYYAIIFQYITKCLATYLLYFGWHHHLFLSEISITYFLSVPSFFSAVLLAITRTSESCETCIILFPVTCNATLGNIFTTPQAQHGVIPAPLPRAVYQSSVSHRKSLGSLPYVGFMVHRMSLGQVFSEYFCCALSTLIPPMLHIHSPTRRTMGTLVAAIPWRQLAPQEHNNVAFLQT